MTTSPSRSAIILDESYAEAMLRAVTTAPGERNRLLTTRIEESLFSLVMYGHAFVPHQFRDAIPGQLVREELVSVIPDTVYHDERKEVSRALQKALDKFDEAFCSPFTDMEDCLSDSNFYDRHVACLVRSAFPFVASHYRHHWRRAPEIEPADLEAMRFYDREFIDPFSYRDPEARFQAVTNELCEMTRKILTEQSDLPGSFDNLSDDEVRELAASECIDVGHHKSRNALIRAIRRAEESSVRRDLAQQLERMKVVASFLRVRELMKYSVQSGAPVKILQKSLPAFASTPPVCIDDSYRVYQIILGEVTCMPLIQTIDDVLRLRDDRRIRCFREVVQQWATSIRGEGVFAEQDLRRDIRLACSDLRKVGTYRKIAGWMSYLAIPFGFVSRLSAVGLILTAVGAYFDLKSTRLKKAHEWLLLGQFG